MRNDKIKYAVIFRAEINMLDSRYSEMAAQMRDLAINEYGCAEFAAVTEGKYEIAISYWRSLNQIQKWKQDARHLVAQKLGQTVWYRSYQVQVVEILREYSKHS